MKDLKIMIRLATTNDIDALEKLYNDICDYLADKPFNPGWRKGCFPTKEDALYFLQSGNLYLAEIAGKTVGSVALSHSPNAESNEESRYEETYFEDILFVHILVTHPSYLRQGIGTAMLHFAETLGKQENVRAIRLYVYEKNTVAINTYEQSGYTFVEKADVGLSQFGLHWFYLYEKTL